MVTVREIARRAGVSLGTVDRVLHDRGRVSPQTAARVKSVIEELGFTPNFFARNLSVSREYRIGLAMPDPAQDEGYWKAPLSGIEAAIGRFRAYGFALRSSFFDRYDARSFEGAVGKLIAEGVDGLLMAPVLEQAALSALDALDAQALPPVVCFDTGIDHPSVLCRIGQDSFRSGRLAAHLMRPSIRDGGAVAAIMPSTDNKHIALRVEGFRSAMAEAGFEILARTRSPGAAAASMEEAITGISRERADLSGLLVADSTTHLAARALASLGLGGLPLIGYDLLEEDLPFLESGGIDFLIAQSPAMQGEMAVGALFDILVHRANVELDLLLPITIVAKENYADYASG